MMSHRGLTAIPRETAIEQKAARDDTLGLFRSVNATGSVIAAIKIESRIGNRMRVFITLSFLKR